jgi:hypothetical protein
MASLQSRKIMFLKFKLVLQYAELAVVIVTYLLCILLVAVESLLPSDVVNEH